MARAGKLITGQRSASARAGAVSASASTSPAELPQSAEAEIAVLGSMILNNETIDVIMPIITAEDMASIAHARIFAAIAALHDEQRAVDLITVRDELSRRGELESIGGIPYVSAIVDAVPAAANAEYYAQIVREKAINRNLAAAARDIMESVVRGEQKSRELLDHAQALIFQIAEKGTAGSVTAFKDVLKAAFEIIDRGNQGHLTGLDTGFADLNEYTSGLQNGELIIVAGRPSMGKTSFALNIIEHVGVTLGLPAVLFSLEMSKEQVARNMLCSHARLDSHRLRRGRLGQDELRKLSLHVGALSEATIFIDDTPSLGCFEIRSKVRRLKAQHGVRLVVVDYLQLMESTNKESRQQAISDISRGLKGLAREMQVPVIAIAQLNRQVEQRDDHRPRMADLRESGSLEQDADVVLLLHRPAYYQDANSEDRTAECIIAKQRNGPTGKVNLTFLRECLRFESSTAIPEYQ